MYFHSFFPTGAFFVFVCIGYSSTLFAVAGRSGEEILDRMNKAKENFYSYAQNSAREEGMIHNRHYFARSRTEEEGGDLLWVESTITSGPDDDIPRVEIKYYIGLEKKYWYYPDIGIAVDVSFQSQILKDNLEKAQQKLEGATITFEAVNEIKYDNADCFDVKKTLTRDGEILSEEHYIIDRVTYLPRLYEGTKLGQSFKTVYHGIRFEPELTLDFFELPEGVGIKTATNWEEFSKVMQEINEIQYPPPKMETMEELNVRLAARRAKILASYPTVEEEVARIQSERAAAKQAEIAGFVKQQEEVKRKDSRRRTFVLMTINVIVLAWIVYRIRKQYVGKQS